MSRSSAAIRHRDESTFDMGTRALAGAVSGIGAGIVFAMLTMGYTAIVGIGFWAPLRMIATIAGYEMGATFAAVPVVVAIVIHMMLSALYGAAFGVVAGGLERTLLLAAGVGFGLLLYVVNFELMTGFAQFAAFRAMAGNWFEILVHAVYGLLLAGGIAAWRTSRTADR